MSCFHGIGQWAATFACENVQAGQAVKISGSGAVSPCEDGDAFGGVAVSVGRDGKACSVALGGIVRASFSGSAPSVGWSALAADGKGGVKCCEDGREFLIVSVDGSAAEVSFVL